MNIYDVWTILEQTTSSKYVVLATAGAFGALKLFFISRLAPRSYYSQAVKTSVLFLGIALTASVFGDIAWVVRTIRIVFSQESHNWFTHFIINTAWCLNPLVPQFLGLFSESISTNQFRFSKRHYCAIAVTTLLVCFSAAITCIGIANVDIIFIRWIFFISRHASSLISLGPIMLPSLLVATYRIYTKECPRILRNQLKWLLFGGIIPFWIAEIIQTFPSSAGPSWITNSYTVVNISNLLLTFSLLYCSRKIIGMRFLDIHDHVKSRTEFQFARDFTSIIEQLSHVTNPKELRHITQRFFKEAFDVPLVKTVLFIRKPNTDSPHAINKDNSMPTNPIAEMAETFVAGHGTESERLAQKHKIFIYDEIAFNRFYKSTEEWERLHNFMESINADIFLPICEKREIIAFIIIDRLARKPEQLYSDVERDEMIIFAEYLGKIINLMQHKNLEILALQEKKLLEELYQKHQEINQYKESIYSFLRPGTEKPIGILLYKNRRFSFSNQAAKELIPINPNIQEGHPLARDLKRIATAAETYKSPQRLQTKDANGDHLVLDAIPNIDHNSVFITVSYPRISDVVRRQIDCLKDPSQWDYLLYLETTKSGKLINQLIPGSGEALLTFKINLLKTALTKQAILLDIPDEDLDPTVELLHHISLRDTLYILTLKGQEHNCDTGIKLFGINKLFNIAPPEPCLFEKLHETGTLFIKNIHLLSMETQQHVAECIKYGMYRPLKSTERINGNVRIICSTNQNLSILAQEGQFSRELFAELQHTRISMPSLHSLPKEELETLAEGFGQQAIGHTDFNNLLSLNQQDKNRLCHIRPTSLVELKNRVQQILSEKSVAEPILHETRFDASYGSNDPVVTEAARLGKRALRDQQIMSQLWLKFKNQAKIATLLGVNRSSVNRRCQDYGLLEETELDSASIEKMIEN